MKAKLQLILYYLFAENKTTYLLFLGSFGLVNLIGIPLVSSMNGKPFSLTVTAIFLSLTLINFIIMTLVLIVLMYDTKADGIMHEFNILNNTHQIGVNEFIKMRKKNLEEKEKEIENKEEESNLYLLKKIESKYNLDNKNN